MVGRFARDPSVQCREHMLSEPIAESSIGDSFQQFGGIARASQHQSATHSAQRQRRLGAMQLNFGSQTLAKERRVREQQRADGSVFEYERDIGEIEGSSAAELR